MQMPRLAQPRYAQVVGGQKGIEGSTVRGWQLVEALGGGGVGVDALGCTAACKQPAQENNQHELVEK